MAETRKNIKKRADSTHNQNKQKTTATAQKNTTQARSATKSVQQKPNANANNPKTATQARNTTRSAGQQASVNNSKATAQQNAIHGKQPVKVAEQARTKQANKKKKGQPKGKVRVFLRSFTIVLMIAYAVVMGIIGWWGFSNFFMFYFTEKSPVMGVNTETSRVKNTPTIADADIKKTIDAINSSDAKPESISIRQVGPSIHFYIVVPQDTGIERAREMGRTAVIIFADTLEQPELFATYEAQIIVTKAELAKLDEETILRPADQDGNEQAFPQYGVSNSHTDGANKGISWAQNGV